MDHSKGMDKEWFKASVSYWEGQDASVNGMLGGFSFLHSPDILDSKRFLKKGLPTQYPRNLALDVGAGIGRVSQHLLLSFFSQVSIVESDPRFVEKAKAALGEQLHTAHTCRLQDYQCIIPGEYDLVWIQWVLMYASDDEIIEFLKEAKKSIRMGGYIGIKENTLSTDREPFIDLSDHSIVRGNEHFKRLFKVSGLKLIQYSLQTNFPDTVYPVRMYLLQIEEGC